MLMSRGKILSAGVNSLLLARNEFLQANDFDVLSVTNAEEATAACQCHADIDVVVIGHALDAVEKTRIIRHAKDKCGLPVVLITAGSALTGVRADVYINTTEEHTALVRGIERLRRDADHTKGQSA